MNEIFEEYVNHYDRNDPRIKRKINHSYRVMGKSFWLAQQLHASEEDLFLAQTIGLLHDLGRFEQIKQYQTFNDAISVSHGDLGCQILFQEGLIEKFNIPKKYYKIIEIAIRNHNKIKIEENLTKQELLQVNIIRDADKLDILYNICFLGELYYPYCTEPITPSVKEHILKKELVPWKEINNTNDEIMKALGFFFDFNYKESLKVIKEKKYLEAFFEKINHDELFQEYKQEIINYIEERI